MKAANDNRLADRLADYQRSLQALTANLLRVSRGAGKPWQIPDDALAVVEATLAYQEAAGIGPSCSETEAALSLDWPRGTGSEQCFYDAERNMVEGAMQMVASELLGQRTQRSAGSTQLHQGWSMKLGYVKAHGGRL